jgi:hypothetical protein
MSLDNFQLPPHLLSELYKNTLVVLDDKQINTDSLKEENFNYLGGNLKHTLILVKDTESVHLNESDLNFLIGILSACKLTIGDVAILNMHGTKSTNLEKIISYFSPKAILNFDFNLNDITDLQINDSRYEIHKINQTPFLNSSALHYVSNNVDEKKKLWGCLKKMFSI